VDISEVAIRTLGQRAQQLGVILDMFALDAKDYLFVSHQFDLNRHLLSLRSRPGFEGPSLAKARRSFDLQERHYVDFVRRNSSPKPPTLEKWELLSMLPALRVLHEQERPVRGHGVVEYVGRMV
jgi:hypothetical protein